MVRDGRCKMRANDAAEVVEPLGGTPVGCRDVTGKVVDATLMTPRGVSTARAAGVVDHGDDSTVEERYSRYRAASDVAQVVATYLRCHPRVVEVRYPGLKGDPSFEVAARTLVGGFGPFVDYRMEGSETWVRWIASPDDDPREAVLALEREL